MNVQPQELPAKEFYRLLITTVAPRPIAWVSTISRDGVLNLAPFSFFNVICATPPILGFSPGNRTRGQRESFGIGIKDTMQNIRETGEFVVNVVTHSLIEPMNLSSGEYDPSVNEFDIAKLVTRPSERVRPPHVAGSPVNFECKVYQVLSFGTEDHGGNLVLGEIVSVHLEECVLKDGRVDGQLLDLDGRMGGIQYCRTTDRFNLPRPEVKPRS